MTRKNSFSKIYLLKTGIVIEVKAGECILPVHGSRLVSYLKLADKKLGFLINFNVPLIKEGFRRKVNNYFIEYSLQ
jgi:GxxExxY protein